MTSATLHQTVASSADLEAEFASLLSGCAIFELTERAKFSLSGNDRVRWLNGMITNKIRDLAAGQGIYAFVLNPQGHILGDLYAYNRGESLLIDTDKAQAEKLLGIFRKYIIMDKVEIAELSDKLTAIGVAGPKSRMILGKLGLDLPQLAPLQFVDMHWNNSAITILRTDNVALDSYEVWLAPEHHSQVWSAFSDSGATPISAETLELLRVASGTPRYAQDIRERDLPQETEQLRALNFNKGCYIGQEIVERIRSRGNVHRKFTGFEVRGPLPHGIKIQADGKDVGEVTSTATLPLAAGPRHIALGYVRRELATQPLQAGDVQLTATEIPFSGVFKQS
ncbi:MAG: folate-binding protein YgfZ [Acidobacteriaceae bacterium]|nr:folate-binding protein YgfZ [Acidobacteriaceae bacterium]